MSHLARPARSLWLRRSALAAVLFGASQVAIAQSVQALVLTFDASSAVPIGPWTSAAIALLVAGLGLTFLRRKGASPFAQWCLVIATGGVLAVIPPIPEADAISVAIPLVTSPTVVTPLSCPGATNTFMFQNATGKATNIRGVQLTGAGPCSLGMSPPAQPSAVLPAPAPECTVGLPLAPAQNCIVTVFGAAG